MRVAWLLREHPRPDRSESRDVEVQTSSEFSICGGVTGNGQGGSPILYSRYSVASSLVLICSILAMLRWMCIPTFKYTFVATKTSTATTTAAATAGASATAFAATPPTSPPAAPACYCCCCRCRYYRRLYYSDSATLPLAS